MYPDIRISHNKKTGLTRIAALISALALLCVLLSAQAFAAPPMDVRIGVLSFRSIEQTARQWEPTAEYLEQQVAGYRFKIVPLNYPDLDLAISKHTIDFVLTNSEHYVLLRSHHGLAAMATLMPYAKGVPVTTFGSVIFTRSDQYRINTLSDLRGKTIAAVSEKSLGGYLMARWTIMKAGVDITTDVKALRFTDMPHDKVVAEVLDGRADAGIIRTGVLENMAAEGRIDLARVKVLNRQPTEAFPQALSTELYPEWPVSSIKGTPEALIKAVTIALLNIRAEDEAARAGKYYGFSPPLDYSPVEALMLRLHISPLWVEDFNLSDIYAKYTLQIIMALLALSMLGIFIAIYLAWSIRRLKATLMQRDTMQALALHDGLTGIPNRRYFDEAFDAQWRQAARSGKPLSMIMADIDFFKQYNDRYGHAAGDECLRKIADTLKKAVVRPGDFVARYGGEEFALLMSDTDQAGMALVAERIQSLIRNLALPHGQSGAADHVTLSLGGVTVTVSSGDCPDALIEAADQMLYKAKREGRNRSCLNLS